MKNNLLKHLFKLTATILACAVVSISIPTTTPPGPGNTGGDLKIENQEPGEGGDKEPGISPQNDNDEFKKEKLD